MQHYLEPARAVLWASLPGKLILDELTDKDRCVISRLLGRIDKLSDEFKSKKYYLWIKQMRRRAGIWAKELTSGCSFQAICFDYYGTLVQAGNNRPFALIDHWLRESVIGQREEGVAESFVRAFAKERARLLYNSHRFFTGKQLLENSYLAVCHKYQIEPQKQHFIEYVKYVFSDTTLYEDTKIVLDILKKKYIVGLVTNADDDILEVSLRRHNLTFDFIITSESVECNKPEKKIFQKAFETLNIPHSQIAMVGDSLAEDIIPAIELKMFGIWMNKAAAVQELYPDLLQISDIRELLQISNMKNSCCGYEGQK